MVQVHSEEEISPEEKQLISQLRAHVENELPESVRSMTKEDQDLYLVRWIRARDHNLENAIKMLRNSLQWRKERNADEATKLVLHPFFPETFAYSYAGMDKKGHPVYLVPMKDWDFRKVVNDSDRLSEFDDFVTNFFENICKQMREEHLRRKETGHSSVTQLTLLIDVQNYPYGQLLSFGAMKKVLQMAGTYEAHYPEILFKGIFLNCPSYFSMFITMLKPVIAPKTLGKLVCYPQMSQWKTDMVDLVDPSILPEQYGGTLKNDNIN